jgi:secreted Zn-dependent insulinase-like peptidase
MISTLVSIPTPSHEGKHSILHYLKEKGWATELFSGPSFDEAGISLFGVDIMLTPSGTEHIKEIGEVVREEKLTDIELRISGKW